MRKARIATLPPIAVEERPEKLSLSIPADLKSALDAFSDFFVSTTGSTPTSFNAVVVGILTGYLQGHGGYQRWLKTQGRSADPVSGDAT